MEHLKTERNASGKRLRHFLGNLAVLAIIGITSLGGQALASPPPTQDALERPLAPEELTALECQSSARRDVIGGYEGADFGSEQITKSEKFGYVFRYTQLRMLHGENGQLVPWKSVIVIWTVDCKKWSVATYP